MEQIPGVLDAVQSRQPASGIQKAVSPTLLQYLYPTDLRTHIIKRVGLDPDFVFPDELYRVLKSVGSHLSMAWLKTVTGSWVTSGRTRQSIDVFQHQRFLHACILGCGAGGDCWNHYGSCVVLWSAIQNKIPRFQLSPHLPTILGFSAPSRDQILGVALAYFTYHSLRLQSNVSDAVLTATVHKQFAYHIGPLVQSPVQPGVF